MARRDAGAHPDRRRAHHRGALLGAALLFVSAQACAGEEPSTEPPDPGAPITRSPS